MQNCEKQAATLVDANYIRQGLQGLSTRNRLLKNLIAQRRIPEEPWDDMNIEHALHEIAMMDSNNFIGNVGAGEREGRVFSSLVRRRHFGFSHGIGRSGDIAAVQPKAAGSSLLNKLTNALALHALKIAGLSCMNKCVVLPLATGMALMMSLLMLKMNKPGARYVIWPRIDQQSAFKCILTAGLIPIIIEELLDGDELQTDTNAIEQRILEVGADQVLCVLSTTSCFSPRACDAIDKIAQICKQNDVYHVINNAYGVQSRMICRLMNRAHVIGAVTCVVQSTDKNFMVPVGGSIVSSSDVNVIQQLSKIYPGRASIAPIQDLFITFLSMGTRGYETLLRQREDLATTFASRLDEVARRYNERILITNHNSISFAISLGGFTSYTTTANHNDDNNNNDGSTGSSSGSKDTTFLGSMLFHRCVSGARVVAQNQQKKIGEHVFNHWGAHSDVYPVAYMTIACAIGLTPPEFEEILQRLDTVLNEFSRKYLIDRGIEQNIQAKPTDNDQRDDS